MKKFWLSISFFIYGVSLVFAQTDSVVLSTYDKYSIEELLNLTVFTAEKHKQTIDEVPASVVVLTRDDLARFGYATVNEILEYVTGFYKIDDQYWLGSTSFGVRGYFKTGPFSNVAILVNGVSQLSDKYSDYPDVKITVPVESIERIEIIRGPMAVIYGNGAFFGAINIITSNASVNAEPTKLAALSAGNLGTYKSMLKLSGKENALNYDFSFSANKTNGPTFNYSDLTSDSSYLEYVGLHAESTTKNQYYLSKIYSGVNLEFKGFTFDMSYNESTKGVFDGSPAINQGNRLTTEAINLMIAYQNQIYPKLLLKTSFGFFHHSHMLNYELFRKYYYEIDYQKTNSFEAEVSAFYKPAEKLKILAGFNQRTVLDLLQISDFGYYGLNYGAGEIGLPWNENFSTHAAFAQITYTPLYNLILVAGARLEHLQNYSMYYARGIVSEDSTDLRLPNPANRTVIESQYQPDNSGFTMVPRVAIIFQPVPDHYLKLLYGEAQKHPSFTENYRQLPQNLPKLYASKIRTFELNYYATLKKQFKINSSLFYNQLDKLISSTNTYNPSTGEWRIYSANSGKLNSWGTEIYLAWLPNKKFKTELSFTYQKTEDLRPGYDTIAAAYSPHIMGYTKVWFLAPKNISVGVSARFIGKMETEWQTETVPNAGSRLAPGVPAYWIMDLNLRKEQIMGKNIFVNLKCNNLLNTTYRYPTTTSNSWIDKGYLGPGFTFLASIGIHFK